jgi:hypothetical protein
MTAFVETMLDLNKELENTDFHRKPAQNTAVVLREVAKFFPEIARTINTSKVAVPNWRAEFDTFYQELAVILEENDNTTTQVANAERRNALRTRVHDAPADTGAGGLSELARLQDEVNELKRALSTRAPLPPCGGDCGFGHKGICIRKEVATNKMTKDAAKQKLGPAIKDKDAAVDRCVARYKAFNGIDDTPTDGGTPFRPAKKLVACTRVSIGATGVNNSPTDADCTNRLPKSHFSFAVW